MAKKQKRKTATLDKKMVKKKEDVPEWVSDEIQNAKFEKLFLKQTLDMF